MTFRWIFATFLLLLHLSSSSSSSSSDQILITASEELFQDITKKIADRCGQQLKTVPLSNTIQDGKFTYSFWDLIFPEFDIDTPRIDFRGSGAADGLTVKVKISGDLRMSAGWRVKYKNGWLSGSKKGTVKVTMKGFKLDHQADLSAKGGTINVRFSEKDCKMDVGKFDINFGGTASLLMNLAAKVFKKQLKKKAEEAICDAINDKGADGIKEMEEATNQKEDIITIFGHTLELDSSLMFIRGAGDRCALIGINAGIKHDDMPDEIPTTPFLASTTTAGSDDDDDEYSTFTSGTPSGTTSSFISSASTEAGVLVKRGAVGQCPGSHNLVVRVHGDVIMYTADVFHKMKLINFKAVQVSQDEAGSVFQLFWGKRDVGHVTCNLERPAMLNKHMLEVRIRSSAPPTVSIDPDCIRISSDLMVRIKVSAEELGPLLHEIRLEVPLTAVALINISVQKVGDRYRLIPDIQVELDVKDIKKKVKFGSKFVKSMAKSMIDNIIDEMQATLGDLVEDKISKIVKEEFSGGFPLNIPGNLVIDNAVIVYLEDSVEIGLDVKDVIMDN